MLGRFGDISCGTVDSFKAGSQVVEKEEGHCFNPFYCAFRAYEVYGGGGYLVSGACSVVMWSEKSSKERVGRKHTLDIIETIKTPGLKNENWIRTDCHLSFPSLC